MHEHVEKLLEAIARIIPATTAPHAPAPRHEGGGHRVSTGWPAMVARRRELAAIPRHLRPRRVRATFIAPEQMLSAV